MAHPVPPISIGSPVATGSEEIGPPDFAGAGTSPVAAGPELVPAYDNFKFGSDHFSNVRSHLASAGAGLSDAVYATRRRMSYLAKERPLHLIAAVATAFLLAGAALRVWRSSRYE